VQKLTRSSQKLAIAQWHEAFELSFLEPFIMSWPRQLKGKAIFKDDLDRSRFVETLGKLAG
jgi:hypothetical protein